MEGGKCMHQGCSDNTHHKQWFRIEELTKNATTTPHINCRPILLFSQQQLWWAVPKSDNLVCVWSVPVLSIVQSGQTKVSQFYFPPESFSQPIIKTMHKAILYQIHEDMLEIGLSKKTDLLFIRMLLHLMSLCRKFFL